jgi:hypothetical protein
MSKKNPAQRAAKKPKPLSLFSKNAKTAIKIRTGLKNVWVLMK